MIKLSHVSSEAITEAVAVSISLRAAMRHLDVRSTGWEFKRFKDRVVMLGLDTSHFKRPNTGVSPKNKKPAASVFGETANRGRTPQLRRALKEHGVPYLCLDCGQGPLWRGKPMVLQIDHRDGNRRNNDISNLRWLCPNCHSQTPTFADINSGTDKVPEKTHTGSKYASGILFAMKEAASSGLISQEDLSIFLSKEFKLKSRKTSDGKPLTEEEVGRIKFLYHEENFTKRKLSRLFRKDWATIHRIVGKAKNNENAHDGLRTSTGDR